MSKKQKKSRNNWKNRPDQHYQKKFVGEEQESTVHTVSEQLQNLTMYDLLALSQPSNSETLTTGSPLRLPIHI